VEKCGEGVKLASGLDGLDGMGDDGELAVSDDGFDGRDGVLIPHPLFPSPSASPPLFLMSVICIGLCM